LPALACRYHRAGTTAVQFQAASPHGKPGVIAVARMMTMRKAFLGDTASLGQASNGSVVMMQAKRVMKKPTQFSGSRGTVYKKSGGYDPKWLPDAERPPWLDGSMPGDRGFDPLGLAKPVSYLQVDLDGLDQNAAKNFKGKVVGSFKPKVDQVSTETLQPYSEVFGIQRFRECELIHGRWCMLATVGCIAGEALTGVPWQDAGKYIYDNGPLYLGYTLPFDLNTVFWLEVLLVGGAELYRNTELDPVKRCYPGGIFDPLSLASGDPAKVFNLKEAEIKHGRLAMVAVFGLAAQALYTGQGIFRV